MKNITIKKITILKMALAILAASLVFSSVALVFAFQTPSQTVENVTKGAYRLEGEYAYRAYLAPNMIYNKTVIGPDDGKIFTNLLTSLQLNFSFKFASNPQATVLNEGMEVKMQLESPGRWVRTLSADEATAILGLEKEGENGFSLTIEKEKVEALVRILDYETGTVSSEYAISITPTISVAATTQAGTIQEEFVPKLTVSFKQESGGVKYVSIEPLLTSKDGKLVETRTIDNSSISLQRNLFALASIVSAAGVAAVALAYNSNKPKPSLSGKINKIIKENKDLIVEANEAAPAPRTVELKSIDELKKLAEILVHPIFHSSRENEHIFYVLDGETRYEYKFLDT